MEKVIEKGKVYKGRYFVSLEVMALVDAYDDDDFVKVIDLRDGETRYVYAHQLEEMQEEYADEYLFCEMTMKYPDWEEKHESGR